MAANDSSYHFEIANGFAVVSLPPSLNDVQWAQIERIGTDILGQLSPLQSPRVLADLSALNYMGSAMVALVVRIYKAVDERGGELVVINQNEMVLEVLRLSGLANVWTIVPTREEGMSALRVTQGADSGGGSGVAVLAVLIALGAMAVALLPMFGGATLPEPTGRYAGLGLSAAGVLVGLAVSVLYSGGRRVAGVFALLGSLAAGGIGLELIKVRPAEKPAAKAPEDTTEPTTEPTPKPATNPASEGAKPKSARLETDSGWAVAARR